LSFPLRVLAQIFLELFSPYQILMSYPEKIITVKFQRSF
jgi:hypothetical protein